MEVAKDRLFVDHPREPADYRVCRVGIILAEVCSNDADAGRVLARFEKEHPIGPTNRWRLRTKQVSGQVFPKACEHFPLTHFHYIFQAT